MTTKDLVKKYRHIFHTDYTQDADCDVAWLMEVDEDPLTDSSGNGITGGLAGNTDYKTASPPAAYSTGYYYCDGDGDWILSDSNVGSDMNEFTVVFWCREDGASSWTRPWSLDAGATELYIMRNNQNPAVYSCPAGTLATQWSGTWMHFAITLSETDNEAIGYRDGVLADSTTYSTAETTSDKCALNSLVSDLTVREFKGDSDEFAQFSRPLDSTEINEIMDDGLTGGAAPSTGGMRRAYYKGRW